VRVPTNLEWLRRRADGAAWLGDLPRTVERLAVAWDLEVGDPYPAATVSWVAPVRRDGEPAVLKVPWPHPEAEHEATALAAWVGRGAVQLLDHDPASGALLLERCEPGVSLEALAVEVDGVGVAAGLLAELWVPPPTGVRSLADEAEGWARSLPLDWRAAGEPCERRLVHAALARIEELAPTQAAPVLLHQDLHPGNVLAATRRPWLAIDPKPLAGERELGAAPIVRAFELGHTASAVAERVRRLSADLGLDADRVRGWTIAQTMAWSFSSTYRDLHHETVRWLLAPSTARRRTAR
jgi:streptomycin 6-kinase